MNDKVGKPPVIGTEDVVCLCGHTVRFELFETKKDKFRKERKANVMKRKCPKCRQNEHEELTRRQQEEAKERKRKSGRLPDKSSYHCVYDALNCQWLGTLTILGTTFKTTGPTLLTTIYKLDQKYRAALRELAQK